MHMKRREDVEPSGFSTLFNVPLEFFSARRNELVLVFFEMSLIEAVFFAQFDNHAGPIIRAQVPERFLGGERFESISDSIIPKPLWANRCFVMMWSEMLPTLSAL